MKNEKLAAWRIPLLVFAFICVGILAFALVQGWAKGQLPESDIIDISLAQQMPQKSKRAALRTQTDEPYHYDFFTLLEQPVPDRVLPEFESDKKNPAIRAKQRNCMHKLCGKFAIQVASFKSAADAQTLVRQLNVQGYHAVVFHDSVNGQNWYRVRTEAGSKREQAETQLAIIQKKTGIKGSVVTL